jgi:hypothetical protein
MATDLAMDRLLGRTPWRVIHTDGFTPDAFLARPRPRRLCVSRLCPF